MVHAEDIEYQFGWWAYCIQHPEAKDNRNEFPEAISLINGLDGGYHYSLFKNLIYSSYAPPQPDFNKLWLDLLNNWDTFNKRFISLFYERLDILNKSIDETNQPDDHKLYMTMMTIKPLVDKQYSLITVNN